MKAQSCFLYYIFYIYKVSEIFWENYEHLSGQTEKKNHVYCKIVIVLKLKIRTSESMSAVDSMEVCHLKCYSVLQLHVYKLRLPLLYKQRIVFPQGLIALTLFCF